MFNKVIGYVFGLLVLVIASAALWAWYHPKPSPQGQPEYVEVPVPKPYKKAPKQKMPTQECLVTVITKTVIEKQWPNWFNNNPNQQLTAIGIIEPYRGKTECASIINLQTGESRIVAKQLPVSLFGFENRIRAGAVMGHGFAVDAGWTFVRVGNWYGSLEGVFASSAGQNVLVGGVGIHGEW
ncbi:MAG: hypothetical protein C4586_08790 [Anaerolineaceae bacterium]|nr:MAG: hypothetical protein C4586_08790 [Anaerolineaceae bacterium]